MEKKEAVSLYDYSLIALSCVSIALAFALLLLELEPGVKRLLQLFDISVCGVFFLSFFAGFFRADHKFQYFKGHWYDLAASIPFVEWARFFRIFQLIRVYKVFQKSNRVIDTNLVSRLSNTLAGVLVLELLLIFIAAFTVYYAESPLQNAPISEPEEALWWALVTVSTVGYGDFYPVTDLGRILGALLIITGVGLYAATSGYCAQQFLGSKDDKAAKEDMRIALHEIRQLRAEMQRLRIEMGIKKADD
ncbi:potassium channel family protein [Echinimonas agarilytica]|uniref:potassium channel family protein n=1 Tax=Echinimonas agarilytica TaxID=1215918 RepID=UPI002557D189|nr:potassium channel family protein [Echinimonas agarilytica]